MKRFLRVYAEAIHAIKTQRKKTLNVFAVRMRIDDPETLRTTYDYLAQGFSFPPRVSREGVRHTLNFYAEQNSDFRTASRRNLSISR